MRILNFGSLNIDHVYHVDHFARPEKPLPLIVLNSFPEERV